MSGQEMFTAFRDSDPNNSSLTDASIKKVAALKE